MLETFLFSKPAHREEDKRLGRKTEFLSHTHMLSLLRALGGYPVWNRDNFVRVTDVQIERQPAMKFAYRDDAVARIRGNAL